MAGSGAGISIDTIIENLKMVFMGSFDARRGQFGVFTDIAYVDVGDRKSGTRGLSLGGVPLPADVNANVGFDLKGWAWTLTGLYQAVRTPEASLDVIGGVRLLNLKDTLDWTLTGNVGSVALPDRTGVRDDNLQNWDVIIGVRAAGLRQRAQVVCALSPRRRHWRIGSHLAGDGWTWLLVRLGRRARHVAVP